MTPDELEARKKKKPYRHTDLRRRKYRKDRMDEETHAMDKPKPLEVVSDGDLSEIKKDPEETKKAWEVWLTKVESAERDKERVQHPKEDKDWKSKLKPSTLDFLKPDAKTRPDKDKPPSLGDRVEHPGETTTGREPVKEGDSPEQDYLHGPMGAQEAKRRSFISGKAPFQHINLALIDLVKLRLPFRKPKAQRKRDKLSDEAHGKPGKKPTGIPESPGNVDQYNHPYKPRQVPKPKDVPEIKQTRAPPQIKPQINVAHEGKAKPKTTEGATTDQKEREGKESNVAMGKLDKPKRSTSPIENVDRSFDIWKRALDETGESDLNQQKGVKVQAHQPLGEEEYEETDPITGETTWKKRKIVKPSDKPHKVVDPLKPYSEISGGFVQNEKVPNLIESPTSSHGTPGKHDKEFKASNTSPIKPPKVADPEKKTLPTKMPEKKPKKKKRGPQETRGNVHGFFEKMMNITKPIPDSKGGRGSFQHCINANQDKHNPGGWCKQIERKIGGKKKSEIGSNEYTDNIIREVKDPNQRKELVEIHSKYQTGKQDKVVASSEEHARAKKKAEEESKPEETSPLLALPKEDDDSHTALDEAKDEAYEKGSEVAGGGLVNNLLHMIGLSYTSHEEWLEKRREPSGYPSEHDPSAETAEERGEIADFTQHEKDRKAHWAGATDRRQENTPSTLLGRGRQRTTRNPAKDEKTRKPFQRLSTDERLRRVAERLERGATGKLGGGTRGSHKKQPQKYQETYDEMASDAAGKGAALDKKGRKLSSQTHRKKADYFVEEIKMNVIYTNKILPVLGAVAGGLARGTAQAGKKMMDVGVKVADTMDSEEER